MSTLRKKSIPLLAAGLLILAVLAQACAGSPNTGEGQTSEPATAPPVPKGSTPVPSLTAAEDTLTTTPIPPTQVAIVTSDSQIRRLTPAVFAGNTQPLLEVTTDNEISLDPNGQVTTDSDGQAEVLIQGCLKIFIFEQATLTRQTCRKEDSTSGLGVCATGGLTGVLNNCLSSVDIQTPGSTVRTNGTWFSVMYLPDEMFSMVQVYEGAVDLHGVTDYGTGAITQESQLLAGNLWFSQPGAEPSAVGGIDARGSRDMNVWEAMRPELIATHPEIDKWFESAQQRAQAENLAFPDFLAPPTGRITFHLVGTLWKDPDVDNAFLMAAPWTKMVQELWLDGDINPQVVFPGSVWPDARGYTFDQNAAASIFDQKGVYENAAPLVIGYLQDDFNASDIAFSLQDYLNQIGLDVNTTGMTESSIRELSNEADNSPYGAFIWVESSGDYFR